jgi:hypothetical protein
MAEEKLEFVKDGFGDVSRYTVQLVKGKYRVIYLSPEVCRKGEDVDHPWEKAQAVVTKGGLYHLKRGDIILR